MSESVESMLRQQAWERAKGELRSMYWTFHSADTNGRYRAMKEAAEAFITDVERRGLEE